MDNRKLVQNGKRKLIPVLLVLPAMVALVSAVAHCNEQSAYTKRIAPRYEPTAVTGVPAAEARKQWIKLAHEGTKSFEQGLIAKAELTLKKALNLAMVEGASSIPERADIMNMLSMCNPYPPATASEAEEKKFQLAANERSLDWAQRIVELHKSHPEIHDFSLAGAYFVMGTIHVDRKQLDQAWPMFDKAIEELKQTPQKKVHLARWHRMIAEQYEKCGLTDKARAMSSLGLSEAAVSADPYTLRRGLIDAVQKDVVSQKFEGPRQTFAQDTDKLAERILGGADNGAITDIIFLADSLNDTGMDALLSKSPDKAIPLLRQALFIREKMETMKFEHVRKVTALDTATTAALLGRALVETGEAKEALEVLDRAEKAASTIGTGGGVEGKDPLGLPSYNWLRAYIADAKVLAAKKLNDTERIASYSSVAYKLYPEHSFDDNGRWLLYLQAAQRLARESCWSQWDWNMVAPLYEKALKETEKYGEDDIRRRMCVVEQTFTISRNDDDYMPKFHEAVRALLKLKPPRPELAVAVVEERAKTMSGNDFDLESWAMFRLKLTAEALGNEDPKYKTLLVENVKSIMKQERDDYRKGEDLRPLMNDLSTILGANDPTTIQALYLVASYYEDIGKSFEASQYLKQYIDAIRPQGEKKKAELIKTLKQYGDALASTNDQAGAQQAMKEARLLAGEPEPKTEPEPVDMSIRGRLKY